MRITSGERMEVFVTDRARVVVVMGWVREAGGANYWTLLAAHGPGVVVKRKGTCYCTRTRGTQGVSTSTETLPYITPVRASPIGQTCAVHIELAIAVRKIYTAVTWR